jgi:hypothetical protein
MLALAADRWEAVGFLLAIVGALAVAQFLGKWAAAGPLAPLRDWLVRRLG